MLRFGEVKDQSIAMVNKYSLRGPYMRKIKDSSTVRLQSYFVPPFHNFFSLNLRTPISLARYPAFKWMS